jgi:hypothetical protein
MKVTQTFPATTHKVAEQKPRFFLQAFSALISTVSFHSLPLTTDKNVASGDPQVPVVSSIFTNEYGKITLRFGVEKMSLIQKIYLNM